MRHVVRRRRHGRVERRRSWHGDTVALPLSIPLWTPSQCRGYSHLNKSLSVFCYRGNERMMLLHNVHTILANSLLS